MRNYPTLFQSGLQDLVENVFKDISSYRGHDVLKFNIKEDNEKYTLETHVPGLKKENIDVTFDKGLLSIETQQVEDQELKEGEKILKKEHFYNKSYRSFNFGDKIDDAKIDVKLENGVLILELPKRDSAKVTRKIEIK